MRSTLPWFVALLCTGLFGAQAGAQCYACSPALQRPLLPAPDARGPGFYYVDWCGTVYGPNYCLYPGFPPFQGFQPGPQQGNGGMPGGNSFGGAPSFPSHPFARGPRDYFMWNEVQAERFARERRPVLIP